VAKIARILDEASVRITADTRAGEADAAAAGRRFGQAFAAGADAGAGKSDVSDKLAKDIETSSARVVKARDAEANAAGRVRVAEAALSDLRDKEHVSAGRLAAAEERLESAKRAQTAAATALEGAETKLASARAAAVTLTDKLSNSFKTLTTNTDGNTSVVSRLRSALLGLGGDGETVAKKIDAAFKAVNITGLLTNLTKIGGGLIAAGVGALAAHAAIGGLIEGVVGLIGSIGQLSGLAVALPAAIGAAGLALATLKVGFSGFGQALKDAGNPAKFATDLQSLAPAAQAAAKAIAGLDPAFKALKLDVQQRLFDGLSASITSLGNTYLPILRTTLDGVANGFNLAGKEVAGLLSAPSTVNQLTVAFGQLRSGTSSATGAIAPLVAAFKDIFVVGATFVPRLGQAIQTLATNFAAFIDKAKDSGQLATFLQNGITAAKQFGQVFLNIGSTLAGVFHAAQSATGGFLNSLVSVTTEMRNVVNSVAGQQALTAFFAGTQAAIKALLPVVGGLIQVIGALGPALQSIGTVAGPIIGQLLNNLVTGIKNAIPGVTAFADAFAQALGTLGPLLPPLGSVVSGIGTALAGALKIVTPLLKVFVDALKDLGPILGPIATVVASVALSMAGIGVVTKTLTAAFNLLKPAISAITTVWKALSLAFEISPIGVLVLAIAALVIGVIYAYNHFKTFRDIVDGALRGIGDAIKAVVGFFKNLGPDIVKALEAVGKKVEDAAKAAWDFLFSTLPAAIDKVTSFLLSLPLKLAFALGFIAGEVYKGAVAVWDFLWNTVPAAIDKAIGFLAGLPGRAVDAISSLGPKIAQVATDAWNGFLKISSDIGNSILSFVEGIPGAVGGFLSSLPGIISNAASAAWHGFLDTTESLANSAVDFVASLPGRITGFFADAGSWLYNAGVNLINGIISGIASAAQGVLDYIANLGSEIASGFAAAVGIHSPSTVFAGFGQNMGQGIIQGLKAITPAAVDAAAKLAAAVTSSGQINLGPGGTPQSVFVGATNAAIGSGNQGIDLAGLSGAFADAINAAQLVAKGADLTMVVNRGNRNLARRA
jgi:phage-related protein